MHPVGNEYSKENSNNLPQKGNQISAQYLLELLP
jgi:hypothetical protein